VNGPLILSGVDVALPDRLLSNATLIIEHGLIVDILDGRPYTGLVTGSTQLDYTGHLIVPGFIDVHVHGVEGHDGLAAADGVAQMASRLPRYGVTGFCPTTIACDPAALTMILGAIRAAQTSPPAGTARVLPAHLESNFINPDYRGAQPVECIRRPPTLARLREGAAHGGWVPGDAVAPGSSAGTHADAAADAAEAEHAAAERAETGGFTGADILSVIEQHRAEVGIVTLAPEMPGAIEFIRSLVAAGHRVSLGHSGATFDEAMAGVAAGARHATHLFNRMTPFGHREPGLSGAVLHAEELAAELIVDGHHVHPATMALAIQIKSAARMMAITDGTAGSGMPVGSRVSIGGRPITVTPAAAYLDDGTLAGSVLTMDKAFRMLVNTLGVSVVDAAVMCATTPARELKLTGRGEIAKGAAADLVILDKTLAVARTYVDGGIAYTRRERA
jgi:N-acetylglucosamine-6-phosphate deacetylase